MDRIKKYIILLSAIFYMLSFPVTDNATTWASSASKQCYDSLAANSFFRDDENYDRTLAANIMMRVEGNKCVSLHTMMVSTVSYILSRKENKEFLSESGVNIIPRVDSVGYTHELSVMFPNGYELLYYDPSYSSVKYIGSSDRHPSARVTTDIRINRSLAMRLFRIGPPNGLYVKRGRSSFLSGADSYLTTGKEAAPPQVSEEATELPVVDRRGVQVKDRGSNEIRIDIVTLKTEDLEEAVAIHNQAWRGSFEVTLDQAKAMLSNNHDGHLIAKHEGRIIAVAWSASLNADFIEAIPGSLKVMMSVKRKSGDNVWLHYAVGVKGEYLEGGFGPAISTELLELTVPLSEGMTRGTYSPMNGYGDHIDEYSPAAYLLTSLRNPKDGQVDINYLDYRAEASAETFRQFLQRPERRIEVTRFSWRDYQEYVNGRSGYSIEDYIINTRRALSCIAANMHVKNRARIVRIIESAEGGREGDAGTGEYAFISIYRDMFAADRGDAHKLSKPTIDADANRPAHDDQPDLFAGGRAQSNIFAGKAMRGDQGLPSGIASPDSLIMILHNSAAPIIRSSFASQGSKVLLSSNLFEHADGSQLQGLLKGSNMEVLSPEEIRHRAINDREDRSSLTVVLTEEEFNNPQIWSRSDKETRIRSGVLILRNKLVDENYIYLEAVIGLAVAIMKDDNEESIKMFYAELTGLTLNNEILALLKDNAVKFAINAVLEFKAIDKVDTKRLEDYKRLVVDNLLSAV